MMTPALPLSPPLLRERTPTGVSQTARKAAPVPSLRCGEPVSARTCGRGRRCPGARWSSFCSTSTARRSLPPAARATRGALLCCRCAVCASADRAEPLRPLRHVASGREDERAQRRPGWLPVRSAAGLNSVRSACRTARGCAGCGCASTSGGPCAGASTAPPPRTRASACACCNARRRCTCRRPCRPRRTAPATAARAWRARACCACGAAPSPHTATRADLPASQRARARAVQGRRERREPLLEKGGKGGARGRHVRAGPALLQGRRGAPGPRRGGRPHVARPLRCLRRRAHPRLRSCPLRSAQPRVLRRDMRVM